MLRRSVPVQSSLSHRIVLLDSLIVATLAKLAKDHPETKLCQCAEVLRLLLFKWFWPVRFDLWARKDPLHAWRQISQQTLATELRLSREWVNKLLKRLETMGWIVKSAPMQPSGKRAITIFTLGGMLKERVLRLLHTKTPAKNHVNAQPQFVSGSQKGEVKETDIRRGGEFLGSWVDGTVQGIAKNWDMKKTIKW